ncbi:MAG: histidine kinase dimerization/phospho-acceptor domain-containing protein [Myxococcaceae bacterium]
MPPKTSLVRRVAWGAALAAAAAALLAAVSTSALAAFLLQRAEDRRLREAALVLADELPEQPALAARIEEIVREEREETNHTGILFAVFDGNGQHVAGDRRVRMPASGECETTGRETLRLCRAMSSNGLTAVAASAHAMPTSMFALSAFVAALLAGVVAWLASRPISRMTIAPLSRLRSRLASLDVDRHEPPQLGPVENVLEVDQLRDTIEQLLRRVNRAIDQAQRFAANAAHELRTPLTTVRAELELLSEDPTMNSDATENIVRVEEKVAELASGLGFNLKSGRIPFGIGTPAEREVWRVSKSAGDALLSLDLHVVSPPFEAVWAARGEVEWRGRRLGIVSAAGLAHMKQLAGRPQDLADLEALGLEKP